MRYIAICVLVATCGLLAPGICVGQCAQVDQDSPAAVKQEVERIYNDTLNSMEYTLPSGVRVTTWVPPNDFVREQVKCLGAVAVPSISEVLQSNSRSFGRLLAIQMLGWIGGPETVPPLAWALSRRGDFLLTKTAALEALIAAPPDKAIPVVEEVLHTETNPHLLQTARSVLARLQGSVAK